MEQAINAAILQALVRQTELLEEIRDNLGSGTGKVLQVLDAKDLAELLGISKAKVYQIMREPDFPLEPGVGNRKLVSFENFRAWQERKKASAQ